ncbi:MAG: non-canonical purine NTP phosphatase [Gammaproteobacteria bacterium]|nr:MAG: non-canonical purine NTP phosphatase [Gammaproteobacteria bacterium]
MNNKPLSIIVGSNNPVKINAAKSAISTVFPNVEISCQGMHAPSLVADQPMSEEETRAGVINRVNYCQQHSQADFYVAIEGGVDDFEYGSATFAYVVIATNEQQSIGRSANLPLPNVVYQALQQGEELGDVMDRLFNTENIKQKGGAMALLTADHVSRESVYTQALILALAPFINSTLFDK